MEAADERMDLLDAGSRLCLLDRIDDAAVTAGRQHDQSLAFDEEVRRDLMLEVIGNEGAGIFRGRNLLREASETVDDAHLLAAWAQWFLETALRDFARGNSPFDRARRTGRRRFRACKNNPLRQ